MNLETIYESMITPVQVGPLTFTKEPIESNIIDVEEGDNLSEEQEVKIAKQILKQVDQLDMAADEAAVKSYRRKLESIADSIRDLANQFIQGHPGI